MDEAYMRLSLEAGRLVGAIDHYLRRPHFIAKLRDKTWSLTPELLAEIRSEARVLGVPETILTVDTQSDRFESELGLAKILQANRDKTTGFDNAQ